MGFSVDPRRYRDLVTVDRLVAAGNELGPTSGAPAWEAACDIRAQVRPLRAREQVSPDATNAPQISHVVECRYFEPFGSTGYRLRYRGRVLDIVGAVDVEGRRQKWEITCNEVGT